MDKKNKYILWFKEVGKEDIPLVGGKGANLGEMAGMDLPVPPGFIVTSKAYFDFLEENRLKSKIFRELQRLDLTDPQSLNEISQRIKKIIEEGRISEKLATEIINNYLKLGGIFSQAWVAIRSSATAEDLPTASFAGQQRTFLNIRGEANVVERIKNCWASLFEPRAIFYREEKQFDHFKVGIAVPVQEMIPSFVSGVMFTSDPVNLEKNRLVIEAIYGLGELIVQGSVTPDQYVLERNTVRILKREIAKQTVQLIKVGSLTKETGVPRNLRLKRKLTDGQIVALAKIGKKIHRHYFYPQDIEWALSQNKLFILQTRPITTIKERESKRVEEQEIKRKPILTGQPASPGMATGPVQLIKSPQELNKIKNGDILVTSMTSPDFVPAMKKVAAIVTDKGGQTSHAAIVSRELGIPCVVGTETATQKLKNGQIITVNGTKGEIYKGGMINQVPSTLPPRPAGGQVSRSPALFKTATKIYVNLAEPDLAEPVSQRNVDGVGLLRAEFMLAQIGIHPQKIIHDKKQKVFINELAEKMVTFCKHFYPRPVVYRATDFKTNEYRHLIGGKAYEPAEENPLLGFRGAYRYLANPRVFELELQALKKVREQFTNLWLMIPFVRTPKELQEVKRIIVANGLSRGATFKLWLMVEIPANVILLKDFIKVGVDGVSIGSNDLTMLILGVDRDNSELASTFNELDPAVLWALEKTIKICQKEKISCSICGQAPSQSPDLLEKLVAWGINSVSVNADAIERTRELIYDLERKKVAR